MSFLLAQDDPGFRDSDVLNEFLLPFGEWMRQLVFWTDQNLGSTEGSIFDLLGIIRWPFNFFVELIVRGDTSIQTIPWVWLVIVMFLITSFTRNVRVGVMVAAMLTICGLLGPDYWEETAKTIGLIAVSVILSAIIGIPLGILSGRVDGVWNVVRPTLDAMQVVHSFVYMLPFVFFWGIGEVSATMVTMVFALPPLVRLTNLGIRQVPEDVVEAARAYGAPETKVLTEVQLPLARSAIMTGLNQTLLLAISMLGIAAIMGAGGLGLLVFRAINNSSVSLAASAGLGLFLVAVVLDRMTQREDSDGGNLFARFQTAFAYRKDAEGSYEAAQGEENSRQAAASAVASVDSTGKAAPVKGSERLGLMIAGVGGLVASVSVFLTWSIDSGGISAWARRVDQDLTGTFSNGLSATGGSWFGFIVLGCGLLGFFWAAYNMFTVPAGVVPMLGKAQGVMLLGLVALIAVIAVGSLVDIGVGTISTVALVLFAVLIATIALDAYLDGMQRAGADGITVLGITSLGASLAFAFVGTNPISVAYAHGFGVWLAVIGSGLMVVGALMALAVAPYSPRRPLPINISAGRIFGVTVGLLLIIVGSISGWSFDTRTDAVVTPEIQQQIDDLRQQALDDPSLAPTNATLITNLVNSARDTDEIILNALSNDGSRLGRIVVPLGVLGLIASLPAAGLLGGGERRRWQMCAVLAGFGLAVVAVSIAWVASLARVADPRFVSGVGVFITGVGGFIIFASARGVLTEFRRSRVYAADTGDTNTAPSAGDDVVLSEEEAALAGV